MKILHTSHYTYLSMKRSKKCNPVQGSTMIPGNPVDSQFHVCFCTHTNSKIRSGQVEMSNGRIITERKVPEHVKQKVHTCLCGAIHVYTAKGS